MLAECFGVREFDGPLALLVDAGVGAAIAQKWPCWYHCLPYFDALGMACEGEKCRLWYLLETCEMCVLCGTRMLRGRPREHARCGYSCNPDTP